MRLGHPGSTLQEEPGALASAGPVVAAALGAGAGVLVGRAWPGVAAAFGIGALLAVASIAPARHRQAAAVMAAVVAVALGSAANAGLRAGAEASRLLPELAAQKAPVAACGDVLGERPRSLEVEVRVLEYRGTRWRLREPALLVGEEAGLARAGERICVKGSLSLPREAQASVDEVPVEAVARTLDAPVFLAADVLHVRGVGSPIRFAAGLVRERFRERATAALPEVQAGLLLGMTTGDRTLLDDETVEAFRTTGLAHLVAVSGFHVAVVLGLLGALVRVVVRRGRWLRAVIVAGPLVFFAFLVGLTPSVLRATVTAGIVLAVVASGRTSEGLRTASAAFVVLVFASPTLLLQPGFQMSFGATTGIILWAVTLTDRIAGWWPSGGGVARAASAVMGTALAAQIGVAPLLALHFGRVPAMGGLANLVCVPLAPLVVGGGLVTLTFASLSDGLSWAPVLVRLPIDVILVTARTFAGLPLASLDAGAPVAAALTLLVAVFLTRSRVVRVVGVALALVLVSVSGGRIVAERLEACPSAEIRAVDIGGTAVLLRAGGVTVLGDGGPREGDLVRKLRALGIGHLDVVIASHPHADHTEGLEEVVRHLRVGAVLAPPTIGWGTGRGLVEAAEAAEVPLRIATTGEVFEVGPDLRLEVLAPDRGRLPAEEPSLINRYNLVVRAEVDGVSVLLPGDADSLAQMLLARRAPLRSEVLVAPHHGSADLDAGFVEAVSPTLTLVTVGRYNRYGHPKQEALDLYETQGPVLRTDTDGDVSLCLVDGGLEIRTSLAPRGGRSSGRRRRSSGERVRRAASAGAPPAPRRREGHRRAWCPPCSPRSAGALGRPRSRQPPPSGRRCPRSELRRSAGRRAEAARRSTRCSR